MTKNQYIQRWLTNYPINQKVILKLVGSTDGKLTIACSMLNPLSRRMAYLRNKFESGRCLLGYKTCLEEISSDLDSTISYIEDFLAILYKRELDRPLIKQLLSVLKEAKQFKSGLVN